MSIATKRALTFAVSIALLALGSMQSAAAHTELVGSTPAADAVLTSVPTEIVLEFSEALLVLSEKETSSISVTSPSETNLAVAQAKVSGRTLSASLIRSEESGTFIVSWRAVADDGHPVEGNYSFSVKRESGGTPSPEVTALAEPEVSTQGSNSMVGTLIFGLVALLALTLIILRWRRNSGD